MKNLVSVIIPVYNVERYLPRCLEGVLAQTWSNFEAILIDDGSADSSGRICDDYSKRDSRIRVFHIRNHGCGYARNYGLKVSRGAFIHFVDADDYLHPRALELLYSAISRGFDIAVCGFIVCDSEVKEPFLFPKGGTSFPEIRGISPYSCAFDLFSSNPMQCLSASVVWNKLFTRSLLEGMSYNKSVMEDICWNFEVYLRAPKMAFIDADLYAYFQWPGSITHSFNLDTQINQLIIFKNFLDKTPDDNQELRGSILRKIYRRILTLRYHTKGTGSYPEFRKVSWELLRQTRKKFLSSHHIPLSEKITFRILWAFPALVYCAMKIKGN